MSDKSIPPVTLPKCSHCGDEVGPDGGITTKVVGPCQDGRMYRKIDGHICGKCMRKEKT